jgi:anaerobic magnesium-protoporphyrin IX monomethyl ester cyclase
VKVLFLECDQERRWATCAIGPAFLAAFLRANGHAAELIRIGVDVTLDEVATRVRAAAPGLIGMSLTTRQWLRGRDVARGLRERGVTTPIVAGGLHPTFSADEVLAHAGFDYVCIGEGEQALLELVEALAKDPANVPPIANLQVRGGPRATPRKPFEPIDALPWMARDMLDEHSGVVHMCTQRGCPFPCTYCAARMYNELYEGAEVDYGRRRSHASVLAELEDIRSKGPLSYVIFLDDTFTIHHPWVKEFCRVYGERLRVPFSLHARCDTVTPDLLKRLADAGCKHITFGVESGSPRVRRDIMKRPITDERMKDAFRWSKELGIITTANYMLGLPGETKDDLEQTLALHEELEPDDFGYFVFYPYPGTMLFRTCRDAGYLPANYLDLPANHRRTILRLPDLSPEDISDAYDRFTAARERLFRRKYGDQVATALIESEMRASAAMG